MANVNEENHNDRLQGHWHDKGHTHDDLDSSPASIIKAAPSAVPSKTIFTWSGGDDSYGRPPVFNRQSSFTMNRSINDSQETTLNVDPNPIKSFHDRLTSFSTWPDWACISPSDVALAGMRYMGHEDKVQCDFCKGILYSWEKNDDPLYEHRKHFSACEFLKGRSWEVVQRHLTQQPQTEAQQKHDDNLCNPDTNNKHTSSLDDVIHIVTQMGYTEEIINIAIKTLLTTLAKDKINTSILLDHIFELESEANLSETDDYLSRDLSGIVIVDKDNVLTKQTNLDKCDKRIFCNASNVVVDPSVLNCSIARAASNVYPQVKLLQKSICDDDKTMSYMENNTEEILSNKQNQSVCFAAADTQTSSCSFYHEKDINKYVQTCNLSAKKPTKRITSKLNSLSDKSVYFEPNNSKHSKHDDSSIDNSAYIKPQNSRCSEQICDDLQADCDSGSSLCDISILKPHDVSKCLPQNSANKDSDVGNNQDKTKSVKSKQLTVQNDTKINKLIEQRDCLQKAVVCNVCKSKKVELLFLPCRHMVACDDCGSRLDNCLKCSKRIVATVRVYMI